MGTRRWGGSGLWLGPFLLRRDGCGHRRLRDGALARPVQGERGSAAGGRLDGDFSTVAGEDVANRPEAHSVAMFAFGSAAELEERIHH